MPAAESEVAAMQQDLSTLQRRCREVLSSPFLQHPSCAALNWLAKDVATRMKSISVDVHTADAVRAAGPTVEIRVGDSAELERSAGRAMRIREKLTHCRVLLDRLSGDIEFLETTSAEIAELHELTRKLLAQDIVNYRSIAGLADRVVGWVLSTPALDRLLPMPGLSLVALIEVRTGIEQTAIFVKSLQGARQLVWTVRDTILRPDQLRLAIVGALLQDIGLLTVAPHLPAANGRGIDRVRSLLAQHPAAGAAMLGHVVGTPAGLPAIVAAHHERLDGSGYPRGLSSSSLSRYARWTGALNRLAEIDDDLPLPAKAAPAPIERLRMAVVQLEQEAGEGFWDAEFVDLLMVRLQQPALSESQIAETHSGEPEGVSPRTEHILSEQQSIEAGRAAEKYNAARNIADSSSPAGSVVCDTSRSVIETLCALHGKQPELPGTHGRSAKARWHGRVAGRFDRSLLLM